MKKVPPCSECPYKLGLIQTVKNPCPQCELEGYKTFERFNNMLKHNDIHSDTHIKNTIDK